MTEKQRKAREEMKKRIGRDIALQKLGQNKAFPETPKASGAVANRMVRLQRSKGSF